jgi:hypothetical protein
VRPLHATTALLAAVLIAGCGSSAQKSTIAVGNEPPGGSTTGTPSAAGKSSEAHYMLCLKLPILAQAFSYTVKAAEQTPSSPATEARAIETVNELRGLISKLAATEPAAKREVSERFNSVLGEYAEALTAAGEGHATDALVRLNTVAHRFAELPPLISLCE